MDSKLIYSEKTFNHTQRLLTFFGFILKLSVSDFKPRNFNYGSAWVQVFDGER